MDPASAPKGMTLFQFVPKSFVGTYKSVYLMQRDVDKQPWYLNMAVVNVVASVVFVGIVYWAFNLKATLFYVLAAHVGIFLL